MEIFTFSNNLMMPFKMKTKKRKNLKEICEGNSYLDFSGKELILKLQQN